MKKILEYIGGLIAIAVIFGGPYYYSKITGGSLTTAASCSGLISEFLETGVNAKYLREQCRSVTKERILKDYDEYFSLPENRDSVWKDNLRQEIEDNF